jgi:hypothetical protein
MSAVPDFSVSTKKDSTLNIVAADGQNLVPIFVNFPKPVFEAPIGKMVLIRSYASGVHYGILKEYDFYTRHVLLEKVRRIWSWSGAFTLSQVANDGPKEGKLSQELQHMIVSQIEEIVECSEKAIAVMNAIPNHTLGD